MKQQTETTGTFAKGAFHFSEGENQSSKQAKNTIPTQALSRVLDERRRQIIKWGEQNHDMFVWLAILHEETGELAEACLHKKFGGPKAGNVQLEADHVAAVGLQIVDYLIRQKTDQGWPSPKSQVEQVEPGPVRESPINQAAVEPKEESLKRAFEKSQKANGELSRIIVKISARREKWKAKALDLEAREEKKQKEKSGFLDELCECLQELKKYRDGKYIFLSEFGWIFSKAEKAAKALVKLSLL